MLLSDKFTKEVLELDSNAKNSLDIGYSFYESFIHRGVPYFIINGKYHLEGANPSSAFVSVFNMINKKTDVTSGN